MVLGPDEVPAAHRRRRDRGSRPPVGSGTLGEVPQPSEHRCDAVRPNADELEGDHGSGRGWRHDQAERRGNTRSGGRVGPGDAGFGAATDGAAAPPRVDPRWAGPSARIPLPLSREYSKRLCNEQKLEVEYDIPDGVSPLKVTADLRSKTLTASMTVGAPEDRKTAKACTNWLLRALTKTDPGGVHIKAAYGGRRQDAQEALDKIRENPNTLDSVDPKICPKRFEVKIVSDIGRRMEGQKTFVQALEKLVPEFYTQVGQHLRTWIPSAPRVGSTPAPNESRGRSDISTGNRRRSRS